MLLKKKLEEKRRHACPGMVAQHPASTLTDAKWHTYKSKRTLKWNQRYSSGGEIFRLLVLARLDWFILMPNVLSSHATMTTYRVIVPHINERFRKTIINHVFTGRV
jgi:hypothetical protein